MPHLDQIYMLIFICHKYIMILLSEAINKPLGLIIIILVAFFIIRMRKKVETYGINNNGNRQMGNVGRSIMAVGDIYVAIQFALFILFISSNTKGIKLFCFKYVYCLVLIV